MNTGELAWPPEAKDRSCDDRYLVDFVAEVNLGPKKVLEREMSTDPYSAFLIRKETGTRRATRLLGVNGVRAEPRVKSLADVALVFGARHPCEAL